MGKGCSTCGMDLETRNTVYGFPKDFRVTEYRFCSYDCMTAFLYRNMNVERKETKELRDETVKKDTRKESGGWF